jgi:hypothetical protein
METEKILELMHTASERYKTVRATLRYRGNGPKIKAIQDRIPHSEGGRVAFRVPNRRTSEPIEQPDGPFGWRSRAWHDDEDRWRIEAALPTGGLDVSAATGREESPRRWPFGQERVWHHRVGVGPRSGDPPWFWQAYDHYWTFYPLRTDDIAGISFEFDPLPFLRTEGRLLWAGREAARLVGVPPSVEPDWDPDPLSWGADEYEAVVDVERGVLLRVASRLDGSDFEALEVEEIYLDEPLPEEVFTSRDPLLWR